MRELRIVYDATNKVIKYVFEAGTYNTATPYQAIQDTVDNCKTMLTALGIDTTPIDDYLIANP